ncbi:MAG: zinc ribbon domain-containing protein [Geobacter sp.]|nr:MAG: zinc ribbon domain-containing protein [Geobacter sp.]
MWELLTATEPGEPSAFTVGRGVLLAFLLVWGCRFIIASISSGYAAATPLHLVHLPFHEAGHILFGVLGIRFLAVLGGTLGQLIIPVIIICAFIVRRNPFGGAVGLWWLGQSFMDVAIYANDARSGQLMLIGGVTGSEVEDYHDWEIMLGKLGWLTYDHLIARLFYAFGALLILFALMWGGILVWRQLQLLIAERTQR